MKLSARESRLLRFTLLALAALLVTRLLWYPMLRERRGVRARLAEAELTRHIVERNLLARDTVEESFTALQDLLRQEHSDEEELSEFLRSLSEMFSPLAVKVGAVSALPPEQATSFKKHTVRLELTGELAEVARLLLQISLSQLPIRTERIELTGSGPGGRVQARLWISELILLRTRGEETS